MTSTRSLGFFVNGWNNVVDNNTGKTYGISFGWNPNKKFGIIQNYMVGPEENSLNSNLRQLSDTVITLFAHEQAVVHREWRLRKRRPVSPTR